MIVEIEKGGSGRGGGTCTLVTDKNFIKLYVIHLLALPEE